MHSAAVVLVGTPTVLESTIVLTRVLGPRGRETVLALLAAADVEIISFTPEHEVVAYEAFSRFGKGRHSAALNYGDCMSYAIAKIAGQPLLYVGSDFSQTDIRAAG